MGGSLSGGLGLGGVFHPSSMSSTQQRVSEPTKRIIRTLFDALIANPRNTSTRLSGLLSQIPRVRYFS